MGIRRASETYCKTLINLKISTAVHSHQNRKSKGILKMLYIKLCFVMVMVAYTMANPIETRSSSGANEVQDRENFAIPMVGDRLWGMGSFNGGSYGRRGYDGGSGGSFNGGSGGSFNGGSDGRRGYDGGSGGSFNGGSDGLEGYNGGSSGGSFNGGGSSGGSFNGGSDGRGGYDGGSGGSFNGGSGGSFNGGSNGRGGYDGGS